MTALLHDVRCAFRALGRRPMFAAAAVATLAIGLGATTAIFSVIRGLLLRPLPGIARPQELVEIGRSTRGRGFDTFPYPDLADFRRDAGSFAGILGFELAPVNIRAGNESERAMAFVVSSNYFDVLGVPPALGSVFPAGADDTAPSAPTAVVSDRFWRRNLGGSAAAIGAPVWVNGQPVTVIGVAPAAFHGHIAAIAPDLFLPLGALSIVVPGSRDRLASRGSFWLLLTGRLEPGATLAHAQAELDAITARIGAAFPDSHEEIAARLAPFGPLPMEMPGAMTTFAQVLVGQVNEVLEVAATHTAYMLLARTESRGRELAIRRALGAGRGAVVRHVLAESLVL